MQLQEPCQAFFSQFYGMKNAIARIMPSFLTSIHGMKNAIARIMPETFFFGKGGILSKSRKRGKKKTWNVFCSYIFYFGFFN